MRKTWVKSILAVLCVLLLNIGVWGCVLFGLWEYNVPQAGEHYRNMFYYHVEDEYLGMVTETVELREKAKENVLSAYARQRLADLEETLKAEVTNFRFAVYEAGERDVILHENAGKPENWTDQVYGTFTRTINLWGEDEHGHSVKKHYVIEFGVAWPFAAQDEFARSAQWFETVEFYAPFTLAAAIVCVVIGLILLILLMRAAGRRPGREEVVLNWHDKIPYDLYLAMQAGLIVLAIASLLSSVTYVECATHWLNVLWLVGSGLAGSIFVVALLLTTATRIKAKTIFRNTVIWRLCGRLWRIMRHGWNATKVAAGAVPLIWKAVLGCCCYLLLSLILLGQRVWLWNFGFTLVWTLITLILLAYMCWWSLQWKRIRMGTREIIGGNPNYRIDSTAMPSDLRAHAGELNNLGDAITAAVNERMKSERFKSELITNVSHDLKTPLTSIINYVDLLKKEEIENPTAQEYIEVLDRKSQRLKKLTEDLVEASKASTGALNVSKENLDLVQLIRQAMGEYQEKLTNAGLHLVTDLPEGEIRIHADGRHVWRVLDNLLNNCVKYALEGTRVYLDAAAQNGNAVITVKNVSRNPLNVPAEQLVERFVRGDESRTTEGSGLGLSIARSLTELQGGQFALDIDGDLFKAKVTFPLKEE